MINSIDLTEKEAIDSSISYLNIRIEILDIYLHIITIKTENFINIIINKNIVLAKHRKSY
jgi:hypothetical protein